jgi:Protein of unknown function (DUF2721)
MTQVAISSIQSMIAPAVLMTTAAILAGGVQTMYSAVNDRMRDMTSEKLARLTSSDGGLIDLGKLGAASALRVDEIDAQLPLLRARHRILRAALQFFYGAVLLVVVTMILIAVAITVPAPAAGTVALVAILCATVALLFGLAQVAFSVRQSVNAVDYEVDRTLKLGSTGHKLPQ